MTRSISSETRERIRHAARARGMTIAVYLAALVELHDDMRNQAEHQGDPFARTMLETLGLQTVQA